MYRRSLVLMALAPKHDDVVEIGEKFSSKIWHCIGNEIAACSILNEKRGREKTERVQAGKSSENQAFESFGLNIFVQLCDLPF